MLGNAFRGYIANKSKNSSCSFFPCQFIFCPPASFTHYQFICLFQLSHTSSLTKWLRVTHQWLTATSGNLSNCTIITRISHQPITSAAGKKAVLAWDFNTNGRQKRNKSQMNKWEYFLRFIFFSYLVYFTTSNGS